MRVLTLLFTHDPFLNRYKYPKTGIGVTRSVWGLTRHAAVLHPAHRFETSTLPPQATRTKASIGASTIRLNLMSQDIRDFVTPSCDLLGLGEPTHQVPGFAEV